VFNGRVNLIKRNKLIHAGFKMNGYMVSGCNLRWDMRDKVTEGDAPEVTCKRCKKLLERADENGHVVLKPNK
jgi:hypothetical protein